MNKSILENDAWSEAAKTSPAAIHPRNGESFGGFGGAEPEIGTWDEPVPLDDAGALPVFPTDAIEPSVVREFLEAVAVAYAVPPDLPAVLWLGLASGCVTFAGRGRWRVRAAADWSESLNLYCAVALMSGNRKSAVFSELCAPVEEYEAELASLSRAQVAEARSQRRSDEITLKKLEARAGEGDQEAARRARELASKLAAEPEPVEPRLLVDDITPEKLTTLLAHHGGCMILASPEPDILGMLRGRYADKSAGANLSVYLKAHAGEPIRVDRGGRPSERIDRPALSALVAFQPEALSDLLTDRTLQDRGVVNRWLYSVPPSPLGSRELSPPPVPHELRVAYREAMRRVLTWGFDPPFPPECDSGELRFVPVDADADALMLAFRTEVEAWMRPGGEFAQHTGWASKLPGAVLRIAGTMSLTAEPACMDVGGGTMRNAVRIGHYLALHARGAFSIAGADPDLKRAGLLYGWIERRGSATFARSELWQGVKGSRSASFTMAADLDKPLAILVEHGWVRRIAESGRRAGRTAERYEVHPKLCGGSPR